VKTWGVKRAPRPRSSTALLEVGGKRGGHDRLTGYDAGNKVNGRKIHVLVDTQGLPLRSVQDRDGAALVLDKIRDSFPWLELLWADSGYNAHQVDGAVAKVPSLRIEIVKRSDAITRLAR
jgi:predicted aspartyl protease